MCTWILALTHSEKTDSQCSLCILPSIWEQFWLTVNRIVLFVSNFRKILQSSNHSLYVTSSEQSIVEFEFAISWSRWIFKWNSTYSNFIYSDFSEVDISLWNLRDTSWLCKPILVCLRGYFLKWQNRILEGCGPPICQMISFMQSSHLRSRKLPLSSRRASFCLSKNSTKTMPKQLRKWLQYEQTHKMVPVVAHVCEHVKNRPFNHQFFKCSHAQAIFGWLQYST